MVDLAELLSKSSEEGKRELLSEFPTLNGAELEDSLDTKFTKWKEEVRAELESRTPLSHEYRILKNSRYDLKKGRTTRESVLNDIEQYNKVSGVNVKSWKNDCETEDPKRLQTIREKLIDVWQKELDKQYAKIMLDEIEKKRKEFVKSLEEWLKLIESVKESLDKLGVEPGYLWDMSIGKLSQLDIATLEQWVNAFRNDPNIKKICDLLGRMNSITESIETEEEKKVSYRNQVPDINSREEVSGLELGRDLENAIPSELAYMDDDVLGTTFDLKYIEGRLLCFTKQGYSDDEETRIENVHRTEEETHTGPIIFCVDTSGSMHGTPEHVAKAVTLNIAMKAISQNRKCFLINFSTGYDTIDLTPPKGINDLLEFMRLSFYGGTDATPALLKAIEMTNTEAYRLADIIMISDFIMPPDFYSGLNTEIQKAKDRKCKFHSLTIGNFAYSQYARGNLFDESWIYNPASGTVTEIHKISKSIQKSLAETP